MDRQEQSAYVTMPLALRSAKITRGVSRIVEFPLDGSAFINLSIGLSFQARNNPQDLAADIDQIDACFSSWGCIAQLIVRHFPPPSCYSVVQKRRAAGSSFAPGFTDELSIAKWDCQKPGIVQFWVGNPT